MFIIHSRLRKASGFAPRARNHAPRAAFPLAEVTDMALTPEQDRQDVRRVLVVIGDQDSE
jgi:hypothetical protein